MSLEESEKLDRIEKIHANTKRKIVKIGPVDTKIALLIVKKEEITEGKKYSLVGKFAEQAKKHTSQNIQLFSKYPQNIYNATMPLTLSVCQLTRLRVGKLCVGISSTCPAAGR